MACSEEPGALLPVAVGTAEPGANMKTTFTIEIKDGRGQAPTGRVLLPTGSQRAGRPPRGWRRVPTAAQPCTSDRCCGQGSGCLGRGFWEQRGRHPLWLPMSSNPPPPSLQ